MTSKTTLTALTLALALPFAGAASADIWWETEQGTLYWEDSVDTYSVFKFFVGESTEISNDVALFIDGTSHMNTLEELAGGTYAGLWFDYTSEDCGLEATDPYYGTAQSWGTLTITFMEDAGYFTADIKGCADQEVLATLNGTPGE